MPYDGRPNTVRGKEETEREVKPLRGAAASYAVERIGPTSAAKMPSEMSLGKVTAKEKAKEEVTPASG